MHKINYIIRKETIDSTNCNLRVQRESYCLDCHLKIRITSSMIRMEDSQNLKRSNDSVEQVNENVGKPGHI